MSNADSCTPDAVVVNDPFHGCVGVGVWRAPSGLAVNLAVSIERSWDADILVDVGDALALASALGGSEVHITRCETVDGEPVVLVIKGDRLAITILDERVSDVFVLGSQATAIAERLRTAAVDSS